MGHQDADESLGYRPLSQLVAEKLKERIISGAYEPGSRLTLSDVARNFGVSTIPVREAMRNLEALGLLTFTPNRGATVRALRVDEIRELTLIRTPLEILAATEAMQHVTSKQLTELEAILKKMDDRPNEWIALHDRFHTSIHKYSGLPRLCEWLAMLRDRMRPYILLYLNDPKQRAIAQKEHRLYVQGLRRRDAALFQELVPRHLARSAQMGGYRPSSTKKRPGRLKI
ncbi:MAG: GntR family transcriptional regulator [Polyangiaceae bacterium]